MPIFTERQGIQLCQPASSRRINQIHMDGKVFIQPKLNGERFRVQWFFGEPFFISSYGNEFHFLDHLKPPLIDFSKRFGYELPFDGEIYKHGWPRERIDSALRRRKNFNPEVLELEAHIFDIQIDEEQWKRFETLQKAKNSFDLYTGPIKEVELNVISVDDWLDHCQSYIERGYEGIILRHPRGGYTNPGGSGKALRPTHMLKYKPTERDDYLIIGYTEGTGWAENMLGSFEVRGADGTTFSVGTGRELTKEKRIKYWKIRDQLPGKILTVKHEKLKTSGGKPLCCVAYELKGLE